MGVPDCTAHQTCSSVQRAFARTGRAAGRVVACSGLMTWLISLATTPLVVVVMCYGCSVVGSVLGLKLLELRCDDKTTWRKPASNGNVSVAPGPAGGLKATKNNSHTSWMPATSSEQSMCLPFCSSDLFSQLINTGTLLCNL